MTTSRAAHAPPSLGTVLVQQLRLLWSSRTPWLLVGLLLAPMAAVGAMILYSRDGIGLLVLQLAPVVSVASAGWGLLIWREETPSRRMYHWGLPVEAPTYDLLRVVAGAIWLMAALTLFLVIGVGIGLLSNEPWLVTRSLPLLLPHYLLSSLILYLLVAVLSTALNRPAESLIVCFLGFVVLNIIVAVTGLEKVRVGLQHAVYEPPYAIGWALSGAAGSAAMRSVAPDRIALSSFYSLWLPSALGWLLIATFAVIAAAHLRKGRA